MSSTGPGFRSRHGGATLTRDTHGGRFDPTIGGLPEGVARDGEQTQLPDLAPGSVGPGTFVPGAVRGPDIADGALGDLRLYASTIRPPVVVGALPGLPSASYPQGSLVFLTTDQKLYRNTTGSAWSVAVAGGDIIADSITAGQIAAGAIGADEIAANAVIAAKIQADAVVTGKIAAGVTTTGQLIIRNGDSFVLFDGTSNIFKIAQTGTGSLTVGAGTNGSTVISVSAAGLTKSPVLVVTVGQGTTDSDTRAVAPHMRFLTNYYVANSSGGAVNQLVSGYQQIFVARATLNGANVDMTFECWNGHPTDAVTLYFRYHMMKESAV